MRLCSLLLTFAFLIPMWSPLSAEDTTTAEVPSGIVYQGRLKEDDRHVTGPRDLDVALYNAENNGDELWSESHSDVPVISGLFQIILGSQTALGDDILASGETWLQVSIAGGDPLPRQQLTSSPYARVAGMAASVASGSIEREALGSDLADEMDSILARLDALETKTEAISVEEDEGRPVVRFTGVNVQIVNGTGSTYGNTNANGLGNLIIGYNAQYEEEEDQVDRSGSHNLVVGDLHAYGEDEGGFNTAMGGVVFGYQNTIANYSASVLNGYRNTASGLRASVSGGAFNTASGLQAAVSGGSDNTASGSRSSVSGGADNTASGSRANVSGGRNNIADGSHSSFLGGGDSSTERILTEIYSTGAREFNDPTAP